jgi:hypothetical protein
MGYAGVVVFLTGGGQKSCEGLWSKYENGKPQVRVTEHVAS